VAAFCAGPWTVRERLWRAGVVGDSASQPASGYRPSSTADSDHNKRYGNQRFFAGFFAGNPSSTEVGALMVGSGAVLTVSSTPATVGGSKSAASLTSGVKVSSSISDIISEYCTRASSNLPIIRQASMYLPTRLRFAGKDGLSGKA
jgi:hypothetical protein